MNKLLKIFKFTKGMCDPGESISLTLKREFMEEAANSTEKNEHSKAIIEKKLDAIFSKGELVYKGYVDDPRNTDNAWMETQCFNFHDDDGRLLKDFKLEAGTLFLRFYVQGFYR